MHNTKYKIQKNEVFSIIKHESPAIHESEKVELEILIGEGFVIKSQTIPFLPRPEYTVKQPKESPSKHKKANFSSFFFSKSPPHLLLKPKKKKKNPF